MTFGIIIIVLLGSLFFISLIKIFNFEERRYTSYEASADGVIHINCYEDCKITRANISRFYSKGMFQIVVGEKTLNPVWEERLKSYFINASTANDETEFNLVIFREPVLVISDSVEARVILVSQKGKRFYVWLCWSSLILVVILSIFTFR